MFVTMLISKVWAGGQTLEGKLIGIDCLEEAEKKHDTCSLRP